MNNNVFKILTRVQTVTPSDFVYEYSVVLNQQCWLGGWLHTQRFRNVADSMDTLSSVFQVGSWWGGEEEEWLKVHGPVVT